MMIEEAIEILGPETRVSALVEYGYWAGFQAAELAAFEEACRVACDALHAWQKTEKIDPLTLSELRELDGEPVWVIPLDDFDLLPANYLVNAYAEQIVVDKFGAYLDFKDYGKTWLAYRRRPEEGTV